MKELIIACFIGLIQGLTEFIPVSSSAHMFLFSKIFTSGNDLGILASNVISLGTTIALFQYFWKEIKILFTRFIQIIADKNERNLFLQNLRDDKQKGSLDIVLAGMILATIPIVLVYALFSDFVENVVRSYLWIGWGLIVGSILLAFAEFFYNISKKHEYTSRPFTLKNWLQIGIFQTFSLIPGMSRSGSTLTGGFFTGRNRVEIVKNVFLISIPAFILASLGSLAKIIFVDKNIPLLPSENLTVQNGFLQFSALSLIIATLIAYITGLLVLRWLLNYLNKQSNAVFIGYRIILGILILSFLA